MAKRSTKYRSPQLRGVDLTDRAISILIVLGIGFGFAFDAGAGATANVATVLGEPIHTSDHEKARSIILTRLFDQYAASHRIVARPKEIDAYLDKVRHGMAEKGLTAEKDLTPEEAAQVDDIRRRMGESLIRQWKINRSLHNQYGGRIIYQQLGPEPLDAYRRFLEQRHAEGAFQIYDQALADKFWRYFKDDTIHDFMSPGSDAAKRAFSVPPWE